MSSGNEHRNPAETYQAYMVPTLFQPWSVELLSRIDLQPGERVLDVACGTGVVARGAAAEVVPGGKVTGIDISPDMLAVARTVPGPGGVPVNWQQGRAEELPFEDQSFDVVLCQQGVQFFSDRLAGLREMRRVLRPGGRAGISIWRSREHQPVVGLLVDALERWFGPGAGVPFSLGDAEEVHRLFVDAGFLNVSVETVRRQVHEPSVEGFLDLTIRGASAAVTALGEATEETLEAAIKGIRAEISEVIGEVPDGEGIDHQMEAHVVIANA